MASKVRRVDFAPDEYVAGVGGVLRADEQGVYWMLCALMMSEGGPIERNDRRLSSLCLIRPVDVARITDRLLSIGKITADGTKLCQNRALSEVERSATRIQTASENGSKGGRPAQKDKQDQSTPKAAGSDAAKLSLTINNQQVLEEASDEASSIRPKRKRATYSQAFEAFWSAYPTDQLMSKKDAGMAFEKLDPEQQAEATAAVPAFRAYCSSHVDYRPVHAVRFIAQGRYEGFSGMSTKMASRMFVALDSPAWAAVLRLRGEKSMAHTEHDGKRGWWIDRSEVERALAPTAKAAA